MKKLDAGSTHSEVFTDSQLADIVLMRAKGMEWANLQPDFNQKYHTDKTVDSLKHAWRKYGNFFESNDPTVKVAQLKEIRRTKQSSSRTAKENKDIIDFLNQESDILENIKEIVNNAKFPTLLKSKAKFTYSKDKKNMTIEQLLSDLHYGKKTKSFNLQVCRSRIQQCANTLLKEIERASVFYNVHRVIIALLGDILESETMHNLESSRGCEFGNPRQVQSAIESLFFDLLYPVGVYANQHGIEIDCPAVAGNHDRSEHDRTFNNPGENYWTWVVYNTLALLCKQSGLNNVKFHIPVGSHVDLKIYNNVVLYEHYDNARDSTKKGLESLLNDRQTQLKKIIHFMRGGHYHEYTVYGRGRIIVNGCLPGQDGYSEAKGYDSEALQTLNQYVETSERPTCFYRSFPIFLK